MTFKTILKKQIHKINRYRFYKNLKKQIVGNYNYLFLLGTPLHGNIGDQAITVAEYYFFKDYFKVIYDI